MGIAKQLAQQFRQLYLGGNWTGVSIKDHLEDISLEEANKQFYGLNSIGVLVFHINYYVRAATRVLEGKPLDASDKFSFDMPPLNNPGDWKFLQESLYTDAEKFVSLIEKLPDSQLHETFSDAKYGNYFRNLSGISEHSHYHLGQIVLIKKLLRSAK